MSESNKVRIPTDKSLSFHIILYSCSSSYIHTVKTGDRILRCQFTVCSKTPDVKTHCSEVSSSNTQWDSVRLEITTIWQWNNQKEEMTWNLPLFSLNRLLLTPGWSTCVHIWCQRVWMCFFFVELILNLLNLNCTWYMYVYLYLYIYIVNMCLYWNTAKIRYNWWNSFAT